MPSAIEIDTWALILGFCSVFLISFFGALTAFSYLRWRERVFKQRVLEEFIVSLQEKIQTEEDFQEIVRKMRRDFDDER